LLERIHGSLAPYNVVSALAIERAIDPERLGAALDRVVERHEALRCRLVATGDAAAEQELLPRVERPLSVVDVPEAQLDSELRRMALDLQWRPLPSERAPLFAVVLLRGAGGARSGLVFAGSHLVCDQQSVEVLWRELFAAYDGRALPPAPSYLAAMARRTGRPGLDADLRFWRDALEGAQDVLHLPFQRRRPERQTFAGASAGRRLDPAAAGRLAAAARELRVAPTALLLAAFGSVLGRWSGDDEVVVGVPTDGREDLAEANTIGFFVDTLPVRVAALDEPLAAAARSCHARLRAATAHSAVPFEDVARTLSVRRHPDRNPLFQAWFNDQSVHDAEHVVDGTPAVPVRVAEPPSLFDVGLYVHPADGGALDLDLTVARDAFDDAVAGHLADQVLRRLEEVLGNAAAPPAIGVAPASPNEGATTRGLARRFRDAAGRQPDRVAIRFGDEDVTYAALARRVDRFAAALADAAAGGPVGLIAGRTPDLAAALLGAWETGTPVALLDARLPEAYLRTALAAAGARIALWVDAGPCPASGPAGVLDALVPAGPAPAWPAEGTSHVLATSGSTGTPRLVRVPGGSFAAALLDHADALAVVPADRFAVLAGAAHDPLFRDLLLPLVVGATTSIPPDPAFGDPSRLWRWLVAERPTVLHLTPARATLLAAAAAAAAEVLPSVRAAVLGGDAFPSALLPGLRRALPAAAIANAYGTTEIPQVASLYRCDRQGEQRGEPASATVPIGTGAGARRLVVVRGDAPAAAGELGEICVLDALPPARLVDGPLPSRVVAGHRAVLTGDRGRVGLDGEVEWCGRRDRQLSIAGHRVEPDQVELRLLEAGDLAEALVAPNHSSPDLPAGQATGLVGYVVPAAGRPAEALDAHLAAVLDRLRSSLPPWSVPASLHVVPRIVTDRNGKPDATGTAALVAGTRDRDGDAVAAVVDRCVRRHLPAGAALGPETNFFEAGLDSLTILRLHADLRAAGYPDLDPTDLFRWPNARALTRGLASRARAIEGERPAVPESRAADDLRQHRRRLRAALLPSPVPKEELPWSNRS
jgi:non-ribosomal peptide synthetase component F/aryl carrier-like protein